MRRALAASLAALAAMAALAAVLATSSQGHAPREAPRMAPASDAPLLDEGQRRLAAEQDRTWFRFGGTLYVVEDASALPKEFYTEGEEG